jgi:hypothetical protein
MALNTLKKYESLDFKRLVEHGCSLFIHSRAQTKQDRDDLKEHLSCAVHERRRFLIHGDVRGSMYQAE